MHTARFTRLSCCLAAAAVFASQSASSQTAPTVHPFEQPPVLRELNPTSPMLQALRLGKSASESGCHPDGSIKRDGNDVYVKMNYVLGKFTINNPDPKSPYGGEDPVELRSYGGCHTGPAIEVAPGNTLHVELKNSLSKDDPSCLIPSPPNLNLPAGVGCFNTLNLHTHGLHVSPSGNSDNVLLNIAPGTTFPYEINVPSDHPSGTFWYHAHRHGSTATQVASGASGVLVIRGNRPYKAPTPDDPHPIADIDTVLHTQSGAPTPEKIFVLQQIPYACFNNDPNVKGGPWQQIFTTNGLYTASSPATGATSPANSPWICPKPIPGNYASVGVVENFNLQLFSASIWDTNGRFTSVNGVVQPTITVPAGEIQRWRFVHAGIHDTINLQVVRASRTPQLAQLAANSSLLGNRLDQQATVHALCVASPSTLIPQFEIATDGLTRTQMKTIGDGGDVPSNFMQPGYRSDVLVAFPEDGDYCLLDQAAPPLQRFNPGTGNGGGAGPSVAQLLAYVHVRGGKAVTGDLKTYVEQELVAANPQLPAPVLAELGKGDLTPWAPFTESPKPTDPKAAPQTAHFTITGGPNGPLFQVNGKSYDPNVVNIVRQVNTTDDWVLSADGEPHIFHIHVNPFEIMDVTYKDPVSGKRMSIFDKDGHCTNAGKNPQGLTNQYCNMLHTFRDTVFVENGIEVHARTHYDRYIGEFVIHCHILDHEDAGMMLNIQIVPDLNAPGFGLGMGGMNHDEGTNHTMVVPLTNTTR